MVVLFILVVIAKWTGKREILCLLLAHAHHTISQENNMQVVRLRNERKLILHVRGLTTRSRKEIFEDGKPFRFIKLKLCSERPYE